MKTLKARILICFILSITLTFLLLLYLVNLQIKNVNIPLTENLTQEVMNAKAKEIGIWLYQRISELRVISSNKDLMDMDMEKIKPYIRNLNTKLNEEYGNEYETFALATPNGEAWISDTITIYIKNREYFIEALKSDKEFVISNPIISKSDSNPIVVIIYPIYSQTGEKVGFIDGALTLSKLSKIASDIKMYDGVAWIMDRDGNIFTTLQSDQVKGLNSFTTMVSKKTGKINVLEMHKYGYQGFETVGKKMLNGKQGVDVIIKPDGKSARLIYSPIPYADGWSLGIIISEAKMHEETNKLVKLIIIFGCTLLVILIVISVLFSASIVKPIKKLQAIMKKVEDGYLDNIYFESEGYDEIKQLGNGFNRMIDKIKQLIERVYCEQQKKRKAELEALQSQIKPHFLYNTLDTIQWKAIEHDAYEVADMITALSNLFRISISKGEEFITLGDEIEHIKNYLFIQKIRYQETLDYRINEDESLLNCKVLKLIVQPIVENAIYHGIKSRREKGLIKINVAQEGEDLVISVKDNGMGIEKSRLEQINLCIKQGRGKCEKLGYGLFNVNERIQLEYGSSYGVTIDSIFSVGTEVTLKIPMSKEGE